MQFEVQLAKAQQAHKTQEQDNTFEKETLLERMLGTERDQFIQRSNCPQLAEEIWDWDGKTLIPAKHWENYDFQLPKKNGNIILFTFQTGEFHQGEQLPPEQEISATFLPTERQAYYNNFGDMLVIIADPESVYLHEDSEGTHPVCYGSTIIQVVPPEKSRFVELGRPTYKTAQWAGNYFIGPYKEIPPYTTFKKYLSAGGRV